MRPDVGGLRWLAVLAILTIPAGAARAAVSLRVVAAPTLISMYVETWQYDGGAHPTTFFARFVITPAGLSFLIQPYEVGPYTSGLFLVKIPFAVFGPLLTRRARSTAYGGETTMKTLG